MLSLFEIRLVEALKVRKIDYLKQKNGLLHHTVGYENTSLVVRRAASFDIDVHFGNRDFESHRDDLTLSFGVGKSIAMFLETLTLFGKFVAYQLEAWLT